MRSMFRGAAAALALSVTAAFSSPALSQDAPSQQATPPSAAQNAQPKFKNLPISHILHTCTNDQYQFLIVAIPTVPEDILALAQSDPKKAHLIEPGAYIAGMGKALSDVIIKYSHTQLKSDNTAMAEASAVLRNYIPDFNAKNKTQFNIRIIRYAVTDTPEPQACPATGSPAP